MNKGLKILSKKNVIGFGIGSKVINGEDTGELSFTFLVEKKVPEEELDDKDILPDTFEGLQTDVIEIGKVKALDYRRVKHKTRTDKWRPSPCGVSIGHEDITAGTQGALVKNKENKLRILSNNHVLANSNKGEIGDEIYQPGVHDGGIQDDTIALLTKYQPIKFFGDTNCKYAGWATSILNWLARNLDSRYRFKAEKEFTHQPQNKIDGALAEPLRNENVSPEQYKIGRVKGVDLEPKVGKKVIKSGRTTGVTEGEIKVIKGTVRVQYGEGKTALFTNQIITEPMSQGGDSGSLMMNKNQEAIGLLFAGSKQATIGNEIDEVIEQLNIKEIIC